MNVYNILILIIILSLIILHQVSYNSPFLETRVINLDRSYDRLLSTSLQLFINGVQFKRHSAVDGKKYEYSDYELKMFSGILNDPKINEKKRRNVMACALSHIQVWNSNINNGPILIFEDDIIIYPGIKNNVNRTISIMNQLDPAWHLIWVSGNDPGNKEVVASFGSHNIYRMNPPEYIGQGTVGYILSELGINYFLNKINNNGCPGAIDYIMIKNLDINHSYGIHKSLVGSGLFKSTI
jgi:GR25 family glycosyltransferase involved in LPS biosynthesis